MRPHFLTLANQLTLLRLALIPFLVLAVLAGRYRLALGLFIAAGLSDALDGLLARLLDERTAFGTYLDPIADKLLLSTSFVVLALQARLPWSLTIVVLSRDVLIVVIAGVILLATGFRSFPPSIYGKACTMMEIVTVLIVLLYNVFAAAWLVPVRNLLFWLTATLVVVSGTHYAYRMGKLLSELPPKS